MRSYKEKIKVDEGTDEDRSIALDRMARKGLTVEVASEQDAG